MASGSAHGFSVSWSEETDSTNVDAAEHLSAGGGSAVFATDHQRAGRGRLDRRWEAPAGANLLVSIALRPVGPVSAWGRSTNALALAALDAIDDDRVGIKWPNDVVTVDGHKIGGMLAEIVDGGLVLGIGVNVGWPTVEDEQPGATSLARLGLPTDRSALLDALLAAFQRWSDEDPESVRAGYEQRCLTLGRDVRVELTSGGQVVGRATGLTADGRLVVHDGAEAHEIAVGDVHHLRPS